ncbi:MAG: GntR family transcriptional regulator [Nocardioides sp.]
MKPSKSAPALTTASVRVLRGLGAAHPGRADQIADQLAGAIERGILGPGQRLPAEASLAAQLDVSTLTLREALAALRDRGLITTRRGRTGGSFVAARPTELARTDGLARTSILRLREIADLRRALLGSTAALAAERVSESELVALSRRLDRLAGAETSAARHRADSELHVELATAAQSPRLGQEEGRLRVELGDLWWSLSEPAQQEAAIASRRELVEALGSGDQAMARAVAERQVDRESDLVLRWRIELYRRQGVEEGTGAWTRLSDDLSAIFAALRLLADDYLASYRGHEAGYQLTDIAALRPRIADILDDFSELAVGTGVVPAPGVLADAPYWLEWWWREPAGAIRPLHVNLDPDEPDFFDYPHNEWFDVPVSRRSPHVAGPYVDYVCTNEYTFTLSVPVHDGDQVLGVVAADILCDRVEQLVMPTLCAEEAPAALVNADGRVIAATTASVEPGVPLPSSAVRTAGRDRPADGGLAELRAVTGWDVVPLG